ncbi:M48 family metalloprotease [Aureibacillus halotolerans]|uniref:M48 family metalloprotease n=1 Tax=Aureibacillus halotolerans TaxID=1508390 RepID=UPI00105FAF85|nr:M48 family metalloprotease [Aureibacillus halotolerans]
MYAFGISVYFLFFASFTPPGKYDGTEADLLALLAPGEWQAHEQLAKVRYLVYFLVTPLKWLIYGMFLWTTFGMAMQEALFRGVRRQLRLPAYLAFIYVVVDVAMLPFSYVQYRLAVREGLSVQSIGDWLQDWLVSSLVQIVLIGFIAILVYSFMKKFRHWWLWMWLLAAPLACMYVILQPIVIEPLFYETKPLENTETEQDILAFATSQDIGVNHLYEVNRSSTSTALNAYVYGIGHTARIVMWDTTLLALAPDEILYITAHEFGHFVEKHFYLGLAGSILLMLPMFYCIDQLLTHFVVRSSNAQPLKLPQTKSDARTLPFVLLVLSVLLFLSSPIQNGVSRVMEERADEYALTHAPDQQAGIRAYQAIGLRNYSVAYPPNWVQWWLSSHPPISDRIYQIVQSDET